MLCYQLIHGQSGSYGHWLLEILSFVLLFNLSDRGVRKLCYEWFYEDSWNNVKSRFQRLLKNFEQEMTIQKCLTAKKFRDKNLDWKYLGNFWLKRKVAS